MKFGAEVVKVEEVGIDAAVTCTLYGKQVGNVEKVGEVTFRVPLGRAKNWPLGREVRVHIEPAK